MPQISKVPVGKDGIANVISPASKSLPHNDTYIVCNDTNLKFHGPGVDIKKSCVHAYRLYLARKTL